MSEEMIHHARDGFPLGVQTSGPAEGDEAEKALPALLLLPGQSNSHHWWDRVRGGFEEAFRTVTFDYRGTGNSRGELGAWTTEGFADDAAEVLCHLGIRSAAVFGTSMGGRVAQMLAAHHPERVWALVLGCTSPGGEHAHERKAETRRWLARGAREEQQAKLHELFYTPDWPGTPAQSTLLGDPTMRPREQVGHRRASDRHDAWEALPSITAPTLVLHGTEDLMVPAENAALITQRIPDARMRLYPGGRHGFFEEFAEEVLPDILAFLADVVPSGS
ncbi:alpha/beta hydrolase [Citricoccus zhacaiensis]|uniref:Alpha/beta hydrolase n=1 Tax=Citricoccus zhacaiensis TaxID=489142 RepID=A0ABQ2LR44_9MICC|nr:alpha/beta hydrolase [Citricoccus zhacaiensis]GGO42097.1 alpha/beta hydrolase [Citricoccus zhacaiensis]